VHQVAKHVVERRTSEAQRAFERFVHAHVEPRFDALVQKLNRYAVHECTGQNRDQRKQQDEAQRQLRSEQTSRQAPPQDQQLISNQHHQREYRCDPAQQDERQVACEQRRVRARARQQIQHDRAKQQTRRDQIFRAP
jgi:hypothetical protein